MNRLGILLEVAMLGLRNRLKTQKKIREEDMDGYLQLQENTKRI
jgi:hypothetical protein